MRIFLERNLITFLCVALLISIPGSVRANHVIDKKRNHNFPKLVNYHLSWELKPEEAEKLAKWDVVILDMENQQRNPELIKKMRRINPDIIILAYVTPQEIDRDAKYMPNSAPLRNKLLKGIQPQWYLKNPQGDKLNWWPGTYLLNVTDKAPKVNGKRWNTYIAEFMVENVLSTGLWDGIFYDNSWDNITYFAGNNVDLDLDGRKEPRRKANKEWVEGLKKIYTKTRQLSDQHIIIVGNNDTREYKNQLNGMLVENLDHLSWSKLMKAYGYNNDNRRRPRINLVNSNAGNTYNPYKYRKMRFGLASTLLENGYYSFDFGDQDHSQLWWYDEYDIGLGKPLGEAEPKSGADSYENRGVWKRSFEHGLAILNSSDSEQTVKLSGDFEHIEGKSKVNDGSITSEVQLKGHDGRILLKTFERIRDVVYTNGDFVRFFNQKGSRVRNGFFAFEDKFSGGDLIAHIDIDGNEKKEELRYNRGKLEVWRDDGLLYMRVFPYGAGFETEVDIEVGDLGNDGIKEIFVSPAGPSHEPVKIYDRFGSEIRGSWYPFGRSFDGGYSLAVGNFKGSANQLVVASREARSPFVQFYNSRLKPLRKWRALKRFRSGPISVAAGDVDNQTNDEVIIATTRSSDPIVKTFTFEGNKKEEFKAFSSAPGADPRIKVEVSDVDFDGKEDIMVFSKGVGF